MDARATDPWTSHAAASVARTRASKGRLLVINALMHGPMNDFELAAVTGWQQTSIGKRRLECARAGWVRPHLDEFGEQVSRNSPSKTKSLVWEISPAGRMLAEILE